MVGDVRRYRRIGPWMAAAAGVFMTIACAGCSSAASQDPATHAQVANRAATSQYLHAREALIRLSMADLPAGRVPMAALVGHVRAACPSALRGTPLDRLMPPVQSMSSEQKQMWLEYATLTRRIEEVLEATQQRRLETAVKRFTATVTSIRWSDPRITDLVNTFIEIELQRRHMPQLDVCRAIREWVASGYRKVPPPESDELRGAIGHRWERAVAALGCGKFSPATPTVVLTALRSHQQPGVHPTTREVELMEIHLALEELRARGDAASSLDHALGLSTTRRNRSKRRHPGAPLTTLAEPLGCRGTPDLISEPVKEPAGEKTIYVNPELVTCVRRSGLPVLSSGELVSKTLTAAKLKAAEKRCGFEVERVSRPAKEASTKPPVRKPPDAARQPSAIKAESFRSRVVAKVVACLHNAGVNIPPSDSDLLSSTSGIKTRSPRVKAAIGKCRSESLAAASQ
jgi:hypothetical protein